MNETLANFRQAVADSADLQEKVKAGADLVALGKENGYEFTQEELEIGWEELQKSDEELTAFELDVVAVVFACMVDANPKPMNETLTNFRQEK